MLVTCKLLLSLSHTLFTLHCIYTLGKARQATTNTSLSSVLYETLELADLAKRVHKKLHINTSIQRCDFST